MIKREDLAMLMEQKGDALISILAPMETEFPAAEKNPIILKNLIREVEEKLKPAYDPVRVDNLMKRVHQLHDGINFHDVGAGLAIFVSDQQGWLIHLPFTPRENVSVGTTFHTRDLVYGLRQYPPYVLLSLSARHVSLFRGMGTVLRDWKTDFFPANYVGPDRTEPTGHLRRSDVEYEILEDMRIFLRSVDDALYELIADQKIPVFLCGEAEYVSFLKTLKCGKFVRGELAENLVHSSLKDLAERVYPLVKKYYLSEKIQLVSQMEEMIGYNRVSRGVKDVWKAAKLGQVMTLLVEQHYTQKARVPSDNELTLDLGADGMPPSKRAGIYEDIVDEIIEIVTLNNGDVVFVEDAQLNEHGHIAAMLRYEQID